MVQLRGWLASELDREVLVCRDARNSLLDSRDELAEWQLPSIVKVGADDQRIDEVPNQILNALVATIGKGGNDKNIVQARVAPHDELEGSKHDNVERGVSGLSKSRKLLDQLFV